jgi:ABC-type dipeptide/oligopeptide/nickel transport system permease component
MGRWLARRLIITFVTFIGITILVFGLMRLTPVDPVDLLLLNLRNQGGLPAADLAKLRDQYRKELGLDQPIPVQYAIWLKEVVTTGNLGYSFSTGRPSLEMVIERFPPTILLMGASMVISVAVGVPLGILAALRRNRFTDYVVSSFGLSVVAVPSFFLGLLFLYIFAVQLKVLPAGGMINPADPTDVVDAFKRLLMPATILGLAGVGPIIRYIRTSIVETLGKEYLVTARSKGLPRGRVVRGHAFPNALLPFITYLGLQFGTLMAGAFVVEQVFTWPGMGRLALNSINQRDYPVIQAFAVVVAVMILLGNLLADLAYGIADPRIRME